MLAVEITGTLPRGLSRTFLQRLAQTAYRRAGGRAKAQVAISLVSDAVMRSHNKRYRGQDRTTDVLSFAYGDRELGDILISAGQVRRQAKAIGRPLKQEFCLMVVHGMLHLMGFDHETAEDERRMFGLQQEILMRAKIL